MEAAMETLAHIFVDDFLSYQAINHHLFLEFPSHVWLLILVWLYPKLYPHDIPIQTPNSYWQFDSHDN